jgi:hypothetical protein
VAEAKAQSGSDKYDDDHWEEEKEMVNLLGSRNDKLIKRTVN